MKLFRVGVVISSILIGIGVIGLGSSLGHLYKETKLVYQFDMEEKLDINALKEIYIDTDCSIRIEETTSEPRVTFKTSMRGISIPEPRYDLSVRTEGEATYITMDRESHGIQMMFDEGKQEVVVYLPKQAIDVLEVEGIGYWNELNYKGNNDIRQFKVEGMDRANLELNGNYSEVNLTAHAGDLKMKSLLPVDLQVTGLHEIDLKGKYSNIELDTEGIIIINSLAPTNLEIRSSGYYNNLQDLILEGEFKDIDLEVSNRGIEFSPTIDARIVKLEGNYNDIKVVLPQESKGFEVLYEKEQYEYEDRKLDFYTNLEVETRPIGEYREHITYGEKAISMVIEGYENDLTLIQ